MTGQAEVKFLADVVCGNCNSTGFVGRVIPGPTHDLVQLWVLCTCARPSPGGPPLPGDEDESEHDDG